MIPIKFRDKDEAIESFNQKCKEDPSEDFCIIESVIGLTEQVYWLEETGIPFLRNGETIIKQSWK